MDPFRLDARPPDELGGARRELLSRLRCSRVARESVVDARLRDDRERESVDESLRPMLQSAAALEASLRLLQEECGIDRVVQLQVGAADPEVGESYARVEIDRLEIGVERIPRLPGLAEQEAALRSPFRK